MTKLLKKTKTGSYFENDTMRMDIKYSPEAIDRELIKITVKEGNEVILSVEDLLAIIREQFKQKDLAAALSTADTSFIPSVEVAVPIYFNASKDIKEGELVQFYAPMLMPMGIGLVMEAYKLCIDKGLDVIKIPRAEFEEAKETLVAGSQDFVEKYFKPQIDALKKKREELAQEE